MGKQIYITAALVVLLFYPRHSFGEMMSLPEKVTTGQVEAYLATKIKQGDDEATRFLTLVKLGKEVLQIENYLVGSHVIEGKEISNFSAYDLRSQWKAAISASPTWNQKMPPAAKAKLLEQQNTFKEVFSKSPYELAWLKKMAGDESGAKATLKIIFDEEFASLMKMDTIYSGFGKGPLHEIELAWSALSPFCTAAEKREYEAKMKKVKVHVSSLPQVEMLT